MKNIPGATSDGRWLQFDIMVKSGNSGTFFENAAIHLEYRTGFLGINNDFYKNSATESRVKVFRGTEFDNSTYSTANVTDINSSKLAFQFGSDYMATSINRTELTTTYKQLLRVQLQIFSTLFSASSFHQKLLEIGFQLGS